LTTNILSTVNQQFMLGFFLIFARLLFINILSTSYQQAKKRN